MTKVILIKNYRIFRKQLAENGNSTF